MTIMQKVLDVMEKDKAYMLREIILKIEDATLTSLNASEKSSVRTAVYKFFLKGMVSINTDGDWYLYTLTGNKDDYVPKSIGYKAKQNLGKRIESNRKQTPLEWYSLKTKGHIEQMTKALNIPIPRTRNEIESFYHTVKSQTI